MDELNGKMGALVADLRAVHQRGHTRPVEWREGQLDALLALLDHGADDLSAALAADLGKPRLEGWVTDIGTTAGEIGYLRDNLARWVTPERVSLPLTARPGKGYVRRESLGVALVIAPWNYPVQLLLEPLAAAIAAGNTVVAKPSELAPRTSEALATLIPRFLDTEAIAVVEGGVDTSTALLDQRFDHIFFTGSTKVGRVVAKAAAEHLTPVTLELGGKSPAVVDLAANIEVASRRIAWGKFLNAGQTCVAPDYVLVHRSVQSEFLAGLATAIGDFYGDDPKASADYGRIVNGAHHRRLQALIDGTGTVAIGGEHDASSRYFAPTVITDPDLDSDLMQEEIFGPILPVVTVESIDDAITFINERPKPLALYVFTETDDIADRVIETTSSGGVCVNHALVHITPPELPFGGVGPSGTGRYHGRAGFNTFTNPKSVMHRPTRPDLKLIYPPYGTLKERLVRRFM